MKRCNEWKFRMVKSIFELMLYPMQTLLFGQEHLIYLGTFVYYCYGEQEMDYLISNSRICRWRKVKYCSSTKSKNSLLASSPFVRLFRMLLMDSCTVLNLGLMYISLTFQGHNHLVGKMKKTKNSSK